MIALCSSNTLLPHCAWLLLRSGLGVDAVCAGSWATRRLRCHVMGLAEVRGMRELLKPTNSKLGEDEAEEADREEGRPREARCGVLR